jgi:hypothetical protein
MYGVMQIHKVWTTPGSAPGRFFYSGSYGPELLCPDRRATTMLCMRCVVRCADGVVLCGCHYCLDSKP